MLLLRIIRKSEIVLAELGLARIASIIVDASVPKCRPSSWLAGASAKVDGNLINPARSSVRTGGIP